MLSQCPHCKSTFEIPEDVLAAADGVVRCGSCMQLFNAPEHGLDAAAAIRALANQDSVEQELQRDADSYASFYEESEQIAKQKAKQAAAQQSDASDVLGFNEDLTLDFSSPLSGPRSSDHSLAKTDSTAATNARHSRSNIEALNIAPSFDADHHSESSVASPPGSAIDRQLAYFEQAEDGIRFELQDPEQESSVIADDEAKLYLAADADRYGSDSGLDSGFNSDLDSGLGSGLDNSLDNNFARPSELSDDLALSGGYEVHDGLFGGSSGADDEGANDGGSNDTHAEIGDESTEPQTPEANSDHLFAEDDHDFHSDDGGFANWQLVDDEPGAGETISSAASSTALHPSSNNDFESNLAQDIGDRTGHSIGHSVVEPSAEQQNSADDKPIAFDYEPPAPALSVEFGLAALNSDGSDHPAETEASSQARVETAADFAAHFNEEVVGDAIADSADAGADISTSIDTETGTAASAAEELASDESAATEAVAQMVASDEEPSDAELAQASRLAFAPPRELLEEDRSTAARVAKQRRGWLNLAGAAACLVLSAALALQWLAATGRLQTLGEGGQQLAQLACSALPCQANGDASSYRSLDLVIHSHPQRSDALVLKTTLINSGDNSQPFPDMALEFSDFKRQLLARRVFKPSEYLSADFIAQNGGQLAVDLPVEIHMELADPGTDAVNYSIVYSLPAG